MKKTESTSTVRPIKGIVTLLMVSTPRKDEISDEFALAIIEYLEHEGQLPRRTKVMTTQFSSVIQPTSWTITANGEEYRCHLMDDSMEIRRVKDEGAN